MKIERTKNVFRNTIFGWLNTFLMMIFPFIIRMVVVHTIGIEYLGLDSLFASILRILNLSELGVGSAIVFSMYRPIAYDDEASICALLKLYRKIYRLIGIVILTIGVFLTPFLSNFVNGNVPSDYNLYALYLIYLFNTVLSYWLFAYKSSLLNAHQETSVLSKISIIAHLVMYAMQVLMLYFTNNYYLYVLALPVSTIIINLLNAYYTTKRYPKYDCKGNVDFETIKSIKKRVTGLMFDKVAMASRNAFDSIIASTFLGLQVVALYNNYYVLIAAVSSILSVINNSMAAGIGNSLVIESKEKNENDMLIINFLFLSISGCAYALFLTLYQPFMTMWMGEERLFPTSVMFAFSFYFLSSKTESIIGRYYDAAGLWWQGKWKGVIEALVNLVLNIVLGKLYGVIGIVSATIISMLFVALPLNCYFVYKYTYQKSPKHYLLDQYGYLVTFGLMGFITFLICENIMLIINVQSLIIILTIRFFTTLFIFVILYVLVFSWRSQYKLAYSWIVTHMKLINS